MIVAALASPVLIAQTPVVAGQKKPVVLVCSGTVETPKSKVANHIAGLQITIDFARKTLSFERAGIISPRYTLALQSVDTSRINFGGNGPLPKEGHINGVIDRVSGETHVIFNFGNWTEGMAWHLTCRKPLF